MMKLMVILCVIAAIFCQRAFAAKVHCEHIGNHAELTSCYITDYQKSEIEMKEEIKKFKNKITIISGGDSFNRRFIKSFDKTQRLWLEFRESECNTRQLQAREGSQMHALVGAGCRLKLNEQRIESVKNYPFQ
ncbi:lysozyme inhibitor LprI family protein [Pantoea sp. B65]|uniref:lysozyme inhibitor LprI family protein n=1 Tax=Pantoea sp. B65 TaxID=2813359 RepID=UPI0039B59EFE